MNKINQANLSSLIRVMLMKSILVERGPMRLKKMKEQETILKEMRLVRKSMKIH